MTNCLTDAQWEELDAMIDTIMWDSEIAKNGFTIGAFKEKIEQEIEYLASPECEDNIEKESMGMMIERALEYLGVIEEEMSVQEIAHWEQVIFDSYANL